MPVLIERKYTDRDFALLRGLFESRLMTRQHISAIFFNGRDRMTKKRVQKLASLGLIGARPRRPEQPKLHFLTKNGYDLLRDSGKLADYPRIDYPRFKRRIDVSDQTKAHELAVMDVKAAFYRAAKNHPGVNIAEFSTWPRLYRFRVRMPSGKMAWLSPDAFIRVHEKAADASVHESLFYAEIDRSTEPLSIIRNKAIGYRDHFQSGGMAVKFGAPREHYKQFAFRVLWVFRNSERRNNVAQAFFTHHPPITTQAWMTTMKELITDPFDRLWTRPIDLREAMTDSSLAADLQPGHTPYRRDTVREELIERTIHTHSILDNGEK
jgi:hypothetical protein